MDENNINVISLTFDGLSSNFTMAKLLGCSFDDTKKLKTSFVHPSDKNKSVVVIPDPSHMLKLVRNTLGEKKSLYSTVIIDWKYIEALHKLQQSENLHLANKLRASHVNFRKQKMKVKLAAQLFSLSVADAIEYCNVKLKLSEFENSEATVEFLRIFNDLFDLFNSKSVWQCGLKRAISKENVKTCFDFLNKAELYILHLKESQNGPSILQSRRKTGFLGFLVCVQSLRSIVNTLICCKDPMLIYFPTYKLSQDHIELLFSSVRFHGGFNDNPTARQFRAAYRKLLINAEIKAAVTGNWIPLADIKILNVPSTVSSKEVINATTPSVTFRNSQSNKNTSSNHNAIFTGAFLSECSNDIIFYMAGWIVKNLSGKLKCEVCVSALFPKEMPTSLSLISFKSEGGLVYPSNDVFQICKECEMAFRQEILKTNCKDSQILIMKNAPSVLDKVCSRNYFSVLHKHQFDTEPTANHLVHLIRSIVHLYFKVRVNYYCKNLSLNKESMRQFFKHLVNFSGQ
ncbi:unnamed protein product [Larinioides sclopetarius]|uniref:DNA transposase THAP9 n=1 Tax=Larinioides sclopetarius TaxID=280406 RepID=A0AAV2A653_9ARAC